MKKILFSCLLASYLSAETSVISDNPILNQKEMYSLQQSQKWINNNIKSTVGDDGKVTFLYGATLPSIVTSVLNVTDIQFEPGEAITDFQCGDTVRWVISPSISGKEPNLISHVIIKPTDAGLTTSLAVMTTKRTYNFKLVSTRDDYMPIVSFVYKDQIDAKWADYKKAVADSEKAKQLETSSPSVTKNIDNLDFNYNVSGSTSWKPIRVYNDGVKTYIQLPKEAKYNEIPVLMVLDNNDKKMVNYRFKNDRYIVDKLFSEAVLIMGVGMDQEKITISKTDKQISTHEQHLKDMGIEQ